MKGTEPKNSGRNLREACQVQLNLKAFLLLLIFIQNSIIISVPKLTALLFCEYDFTRQLSNRPRLQLIQFNATGVQWVRPEGAGFALWCFSWAEDIGPQADAIIDVSTGRTTFRAQN